ncbi:MAG: SpoIIE family protein phosphatase [Calditrichaeota bacterium]|nr:SpoIIE family protein phosphatase [Calditrichota bacterium]
MCTDGLVEAHNEQGENFETLGELVRLLGGRLSTALVKAMTVHTGAQTWHDDLTFVVIKTY